jgi:hypothetical protein
MHGLRHFAIYTWQDYIDLCSQLKTRLKRIKNMQFYGSLMNNTSRVLVTLFTVLGAFSIVLPAHAATVYSQTPTEWNASESDTDAPALRADQFTLTGADTVRSLLWHGVYFNNDTPLATDNFSVSFYSDSSGLPGSLIQTITVGNPSSRVTTGSNTTGGAITANCVAGKPHGMWHWGYRRCRYPGLPYIVNSI